MNGKKQKKGNPAPEVEALSQLVREMVAAGAFLEYCGKTISRGPSAAG